MAVKVVGTKPAENILIYVPAILRTVSATEYVAAGEDVYVCTFAPGKVFERVFLKAKITDFMPSDISNLTCPLTEELGV